MPGTMIDKSCVPVVSLFSGAGGLDTGFMRAGFLPILAVDASDAACQTFQHNYPTVTVIKKDLSAVKADFSSKEENPQIQLLGRSPYR